MQIFVFHFATDYKLDLRCRIYYVQMMDTNYDENLNENSFFKVLRNEYNAIFQKALFENWIICVPCSESLENYELNEQNISVHILIPSDELPETHFQTLNDQKVQIYDKTVRLVGLCHDVPILFTETYYSDNTRYEVLCLERPLNHNAENCKFNLRIYPVKTLRDCVDLLLLESHDGSALVEKLDEIIKQFLFLSSKDYFTKNIKQQNNFITNIYLRCLRITLQDKKIGAKVKQNRTFMTNVKVSVESYVLHNMHSIVMKGIITNCTSELGAMNKTLRSLAHVQLQHLNVCETILDSIPNARNELSRINGYSTVLGKLTCFKRCINLISKNKYRSSNKLSVDELLPILVFLVVKSGVTTWAAQLRYVKDFSFSRRDGNQADELSFLVSTLEAVLTYIGQGLCFRIVYSDECELKLLDESENRDGSDVITYVCSKSKLFWKTKNPFLAHLFRAIYNDNLDEVIAYLEQPENTEKSPTVPSQYCHPLCSCDRCEKLQTNSSQQSSLTIDTLNNSGCSPLHVAACYGKSAILDWLLNHGANPNCSDISGSTPLHCAAAHGHQNAVLLLMYADAKLDARDDDCNQPLHLAAINGHVDCVKALLYYAEHAGVRYDVNGTNKDGDTPLHLAAKHYHKDVVEILLVYNANPSIKNKHSSNVFELTDSLSIVEALNEKYCTVVNLLNVPLKSPSVEINELEYPELVRLLPNEEYGVRPQTAESIKNTDKLLKAVKLNDLASIKRYLGFPEILRDSCPIVTYKCHPLCACEKCNIESPPDEERGDDFDKIDALSVNICDSDGFTALHVACKYGRVEVLKFLLDVGAKINVRTYRQLLTPLHVACLWNQPNAVKILLECDTCEINVYDKNNNTPLHYACSAGNARIVELLLKCEPDLDAKNDKGKTALNEAEESLSFAAMRLLKAAVAKHQNESFS